MVLVAEPSPMTRLAELAWETIGEVRFQSISIPESTVLAVKPRRAGAAEEVPGRDKGRAR